jgi:hypothetical protein
VAERSAPRPPRPGSSRSAQTRANIEPLSQLAQGPYADPVSRTDLPFHRARHRGG